MNTKAGCVNMWQPRSVANLPLQPCSSRCVCLYRDRYGKAWDGACNVEGMSEEIFCSSPALWYEPRESSRCCSSRISCWLDYPSVYHCLFTGYLQPIRSTIHTYIIHKGGKSKRQVKQKKVVRNKDRKRRVTRRQMMRGLQNKTGNNCTK